MEDSVTIHICNPQPSQRKVVNKDCPICKASAPALCEFTDWYGWSDTCLGCGDSWQDGEMHDRPFARGWRKASIASALARINRPLEESDP